MPIADGGSLQRWLWILLLALLPFGEGSANPVSLLVIHTLVLLLCGIRIARVDWTSGTILPAGLRLPSILFLVVLFISSLGSPYPYASFLRSWALAFLFFAFPAALAPDCRSGL